MADKNDFEKAGFVMTDTGGGCTAYVLGDWKGESTGEHIMITGKDDCFINRDHTGEVSMGYYENDEAEGVLADFHDHMSAIVLSRVILRPSYTDEQMIEFRLLADGFYEYYSTTGSHHELQISFEFEDMHVTHPWLNCSGMETVDPVAAYGRENFDCWCAAAAVMIEETNGQIPLIAGETTAAVGIWIKVLNAKQLLWHMDDSPIDCFNGKLGFYATCVLMREQGRARNICSNAGVDIFEMYPNLGNDSE